MSNGILEKDTELTFPHFVVLKASAGSGKTHALTKRFVQFLLSDRIPKKDLKNILAITFSNNAAREMKERVIEWLKSICLNKEDEMSQISEIVSADERFLSIKAESLIADILENYSDLQIKTIDSFMTGILKSSAIDFGFNPDLEILMSNDALMKYSFDLFLRNVREGSDEGRCIEEIIPHISEIKNSYPWEPSKEILEKIKGIYRKLSSTWKEVQIRDLSVEIKDIKDKIRIEAERIEAVIKESGLEMSGNSSFENILSNIKNNRYADLIGLGLKNPPVKNPKGKDSNKERYYNEVLEGWDNLTKGVKDYINEYAYYYYLPYLMVYRKIIGTIEDVKRQEGKIFIEDINRKLAEYLKGEIVPDVYFRIGETIFHYLIDEFQDTSPVQWKGIFPLIENSLSVGGSLFIVGDAKQAIYGFRNADYTIMKGLESKNPFPSASHSVKEMEINYRSLQKILDFNDRVFKEIIPSKEIFGEAGKASGLIDYKQKVKPENEKRGYVEVNKLEGNSVQQSNDANEGQPEKEKIQKLIMELKERGYGYRDIAILTFENDDVVNITSWLNEKVFPFISYSSLDIRRRKITQEIISLLKFLDSPLDDLSFATFVLGDIFSGTLKEDNEVFHRFIHSKIQSTKDSPLYRAFQEEFPNLWNLYFDYLFKSTGYLPLYEIITEIFRVFRIFDTFGSEETALVKILEVIKNYEGRGSNNLRDFIEFASEEGKNESEWDIDIPDGIDAIKVMTIHKAKGLGFPVVILLLYGRRSRGFEYITDEYSDSKEVSLLKVNSKMVECSEYLDELYSNMKMKETVNSLNSLYVGLTRAKAEMYILGVEKKSDHYNPMEFLPENEYRPLDKPAMCCRGEYDEPQSISLHHQYSKHVPEIFNRGIDMPVDYRRTINPVEKRRGELIHGILSFLDFIGDDIEAQLDRIIKKLALSGAKGLAFEGFSEDVIKKSLMDFLEVKEIRGYFLQSSDRVIKREQEFSDSNGNLFRMDRVIIDGDVITVVDFKTGREKDGEDKYAEQIRNYMNILREIYPDKRVEGIIAYVDLKEITKVRVR